jgi:hypothetical protein
MPDAWYEEVDASTRLTQGDFILNCPLVTWNPQPLHPDAGDATESLRAMVDAVEADVVVMTQACDLEQEKVNNVVLCPHLSLTEFREVWEADMREHGQTPSARTWGSYCRRICDGYVWNLTILDMGSSRSRTTEHRIVDFREIYTVPRGFLESLLIRRQQPRLRLLPPYREHLSQAFARFFMRVGLPVGVTPAW